MAKVELKKETSELHISVEADKITWQAAQEKAFNKIRSSLTLKGFRKGQAPVNVARKSISPAQILTEALKSELDVLIKVASKEIKDDLLVLDSPSYSVEKISDIDLIVKFIYPIYPVVTLPDYRKLGVRFEAKTTTEELVGQEMNRMLEKQTTLVPKANGNLEKGDVAVFDFEGFIDGKPFTGGKAKDYELEVGSGQFIAGFEDQMVGMAKLESRDIKVTFPDDYHVEELKSKPSVFKIQINEINVKSVPKINDEWAKSLNIPSVSSVAQLKKYIEEIQNMELLMQARKDFQRQAFDKIIEQTEIVIPAQLINKEVHQQEHNFEAKLKEQGMSMKQYLEMTRSSKDALALQFKKSAETRLKDSFIFAEISKLEKVEINDEDYEKEYGKFAKIYGQSIEGIKANVSKAQMQIPMVNDKVLDILIAQNQ